MYFIFCQCIKLSECNNTSQLGLPLHRLLTNHCKPLYRGKHKTQANGKKEQETCSPDWGYLWHIKAFAYLANVKPKFIRMVKSVFARQYLLRLAGLMELHKADSEMLFNYFLNIYLLSSENTLLWVGQHNSVVLNILAEFTFLLLEDFRGV